MFKPASIKVARAFERLGVNFYSRSASNQIRLYSKQCSSVQVNDQPQTIKLAGAFQNETIQRVHNLCYSGPFHNSSIALAAHQPFTVKTVRERIMLILSLYDKIDAEKLTLDSNFFTDIGLDSLDFVEVIMALEDEFQFEIPDGDSDKMKTPRDIFQYICDKEDVYH